LFKTETIKVTVEQEQPGQSTYGKPSKF